MAKRLSSPQYLLLSVGSAIALYISGLPTVSYAQSDFLTSEDLMAEDAVAEGAVADPMLIAENASTVAEKLARLEAAVAVVDHITGENAPREKVDTLKTLARSYHTLGEQARAVALLDNAVQVAIDSFNDSSSAQDSSLEQNTVLPIRSISPVRIVQTYIEIGEPEAAEALLTQIIDTEEWGAEGVWISRIVQAYTDAGEDARAASTLGWRVDVLSNAVAVTLEERAEESAETTPKLASRQRQSLLSRVGSLADDYNRLANPMAAQSGLDRLLSLVEMVTADYELENSESENSELENSEPERFNRELATTLVKLAKSYGKQGNTEVAAALLERVMPQLRTEETPYSPLIAPTAQAYGYLDDRAVAEQALDEITQRLMTNLPEPELVVRLYEELGAIAGAYNRLGNLPKAQETIAPIVESPNAGPFVIGGILQFSGMEGAAKEALIQRLFEDLPRLREAGLTVSDVTAGYSGITGIVEGYVETTDDATAQVRLSMLEDFFREVQFDPLGMPAQLVILANAAAVRGDAAAAQRLLAEATQAVEDGISSCEGDCANEIRRLAYGYRSLADDAARQVGFDRLQQLANDHLETTERDAVSNMLVISRALL